MYIPVSFREDRVQTVTHFLRRHSFGLVISHGGEHVLATHLPILVDIVDGRLAGLTTHLARNNPQANRIAMNPAVMVAFCGPNAYVSPSWYESTGMVPTWNYAAVQITGIAEPVHDQSHILNILNRTVETYEDSIGGDWSMRSVSLDTISELARNVVGLKISITGVEAAFKLSQNKPMADRHGVVAGLKRGGRGNEALVTMMEYAIKEDPAA